MNSNEMFLLLLIISECKSLFCETQWLTNTNTNTNTSAISDSNDFLSEPSNAFSSLTYTVFGIVGIFIRNHSPIYYLLMNLFILVGITSFFHHYYISDNTTQWTYASDIISMYLLTFFSLFYILNDNEYHKFRKITNFGGFLNITCCVSMIVFYKTNWGPRNILFQIQIGAIILSQCFICIYFLYIKSTIKYKILFSSIWNGMLLSFGASMWHLDNICPTWSIERRFNGHTIWHITVSWALFNTINITIICRYTFNKIKFIWRPLFIKLPGFLYIIQVGTEKTNIKNNYTNINLEEIKLISNPKSHRRINTYG